MFFESLIFAPFACDLDGGNFICVRYYASTKIMGVYSHGEYLDECHAFALSEVPTGTHASNNPFVALGRVI